MILAEILEWYATISGIIAAFLLAGDFGRRVTGSGFILFCTMNLAWIGFALMDETGGLVTQNVVLFFINAFGIYRYLIRKRAPGAPA
ncbi:hypothetical protein [Sphingosinicella terrae]|jgi:hypothetical protein|uniref:hypothetical protein n=1 Tax=Sphingosinicella terrae TaxID=2172047 RepID=UPI000E0CD7F4|nr:hypothetical protein [Sphingosinicella terrae]